MVCWTVNSSSRAKGLNSYFGNSYKRNLQGTGSWELFIANSFQWATYWNHILRTCTEGNNRNIKKTCQNAVSVYFYYKGSDWSILLQAMPTSACAARIPVLVPRQDFSQRGLAHSALTNIAACNLKYTSVIDYEEIPSLLFIIWLFRVEEFVNY
jgi:hypothetical protein